MLADAGSIESILFWCWSSWVQVDGGLQNLSVGQTVTVWYSNTGDIKGFKPYKARLTEECIDNVWNVKWSSDATNKQQFQAAVDPWIVAAEN